CPEFFVVHPEPFRESQGVVPWRKSGRSGKSELLEKILVTFAPLLFRFGMALMALHLEHLALLALHPEHLALLALHFLMLLLLLVKLLLLEEEHELQLP
ncbi:hypothetical protein Taro_000773, partial [Colocasia esculenta]|nr:hypothetical protein [Colocasia esculenta]